jgi:hypothetical protein
VRKQLLKITINIRTGDNSQTDDESSITNNLGMKQHLMASKRLLNRFFNQAPTAKGCEFGKGPTSKASGDKGGSLHGNMDAYTQELQD